MFELIVRTYNDKALRRANAVAVAVANDDNMELRDISWCVLSTDLSYDKES